MKAHPDKNDGSAASTLEFQRLADAYQILTQYDENPTGARVASNYEPEDDGFESDDEGFGSGMHSDEFYQYVILYFRFETRLA